MDLLVSSDINVLFCSDVLYASDPLQSCAPLKKDAAPPIGCNCCANVGNIK